MKKIINFVIMGFLCISTACYANGADIVVDDYFQASENQSYYHDLENVPWAIDAIEYLTKCNAISGGGEFHPDKNITREEFIKILIVSFGIYDENASSSFTDSSKSDWHYGYISTAKNHGITNGVNETEFGVGKSIERQEIAALIFRTIKILNLPTTEAVKSTFNDDNKIADYAKNAVAYLQNEQVLKGNNDNNFNPNQYATRAEACKMIYEAIKKYLINI